MSAWTRCALIVAALACAACSSIELAPTNPPGLNLSGEWLVDFAASDAPPNLKDDRRGARRPPRDGIRPSMTSLLGSGLDFVSHDFQVLTADKMVIEQNRDSMGIRYQPGVYRDVSWGERQRGLWEVYAGWEGEQLVIISRANDLEVVERFTLQGRRLTVQVGIKADGEQTDVTRVFNARPG